MTFFAEAGIRLALPLAGNLTRQSIDLHETFSPGRIVLALESAVPVENMQYYNGFSTLFDLVL
jgi:hypothetical protein